MKEISDEEQNDKTNQNKNIVIDKTNRMKKSSIPWLFAVIVLCVLLVLSAILGMSGYYFSVNYLTAKSDLVVGSNVVIDVLPNQSNIASFTFDGGYLPNELVHQVIQISAEDLNADVAVRVKAEVFGSEENEVNFITTEHFEKYDDGYYYFDDVLHGANKITFCTYVEFPRNAHFSSNEKYILTIVVETLESELDVENIWRKVQ